MLVGCRQGANLLTLLNESFSAVWFYSRHYLFKEKTIILFLVFLPSFEYCQLELSYFLFVECLKDFEWNMEPSMLEELVSSFFFFLFYT